ncbi:MAG TPA: hypothetical protein VIB82_08885, partial [Caulobacteraceae bacterium]
AIGGRLDGLARDGIRQFVEDEGVREGSGELIQINRRLPDPDGSGASRFPDIYIPKAGVIFDGSLAPKFASSLQIADFGRFSGGAKTSIVRPSSLPPKDLGGGGSIMGSYGIVPRTPK